MSTPTDIAKGQAALDAALLASLQARTPEQQAALKTAVQEVEDVAMSEPVEELPPNRAQRRLMVANMKALLKGGPRQVPIRSATIIPKHTRGWRRNQRASK